MAGGLAGASDGLRLSGGRCARALGGGGLELFFLGRRSLFDLLVLGSFLFVRGSAAPHDRRGLHGLIALGFYTTADDRRSGLLFGSRLLGGSGFLRASGFRRSLGWRLGGGTLGGSDFL